jgi:hypothetical protein
LRKVEADDGRLVEQGVDEMLHLKVANALLDHNPPQTLVLGTGDGREAGWRTSFPGQAERALRLGWRVEVWSWQEQLTSRYAALAHAHPGKVEVHTLDPHYFSLTFVRGGSYRIGGAMVTISDPVVSQLR